MPPDTERVLGEAVEAYLAGCRSRLGPFVDRHFTLAGTLRLHRAAIGADLLRAPANLALAVPHVAFRLAETGARRSNAARLAGWLDGRRLQFRTDVDREVEWLIYTELLRLPIRQDGRESTDDGLIEAIVAHRDIQAALAGVAAAIAPHARDPEFRERLADHLRRYAGTRAATADIATALTHLGVGWALCQKFTPSAFTLGPLLANWAAKHVAVASFPLGPALAGLWQGLFPIHAGAGLAAGMTGGLLVAFSAFAAFSGVVTDPIERRVGLHSRRLAKLIDTIEDGFRGARDARFDARAHYVARVIDLVDLLRIAYRAAR